MTQHVSHRTSDEIRELRAEIERLRSEAQRALDHYDTRDELYTSDADVAAGMSDILRAALVEPKP